MHLKIGVGDTSWKAFVALIGRTWVYQRGCMCDKSSFD